ncbi:MAG TPA: alpha/beta hydrolase [Pyrinomonadaceae bacterium]
MPSLKDSLTEATPFPLQRVRVNDTTLSYIEKGRGEPVVFVHGAISDLRIWLNQVEFFSDSYRAISYSRRSHWPAQNVEDDRPYTRSVHTEDLAGFLDALDLKKVHLVGHSFGGAIALLTALRYPELVGSLVLAEPSPFVDLFDTSMGKMIARQKVGFDEARLLAKVKNSDAAIRQFLNTTVGADVLNQLPPSARAVLMDNAPTLVPMLEHYFVSPQVSPERLSKIAAPTLLISGEFSPNIALSNNRLLQNCLHNSEEATLYSVSHGLHIEDPAAFNQVVRKFLVAHSYRSNSKN